MHPQSYLMVVGFITAFRISTISGSFTLRGLGSGKCLNIYGGGSENGAGLVIWDCITSATNEYFDNFPVDKQYNTNGEIYYQIRVKSSGKCLDVYNAATGNGAKVDQWDCVPGATHEMFTYVPSRLRPGYFMVKAKHSGKCLNVYGAKTGNGDQVVQWDCVDGTNDNWDTNTCMVPYSSTDTKAFEEYLKLLMKP